MIFSKLNRRQIQVLLTLVFIVVGIIITIIWYNNNKPQQQIITVALQPPTNVLYFTGTVAPADIYPVTSIVDGVIDKKYFEYGQQVKAKEQLFHIYSPKVEDDYRSAEINFLKAQQAYTDMQDWLKSTDVTNAKRAVDSANTSLQNSQRQLTESAQLFKLGYIAQDDYYSAKEQYQSALISYQQAQDSLNDTLKKGQGINLDITKLSLQQAQDNLNNVQKQMNALTVVAPQTGIALFPQKSDDTSGGGGSTTEFNIASQVKVGDNLVTVGNLQAIAISVKVNEINVNQIKGGEGVTISGVAFPGISLSGKVSSVDAQASNSGSDLPTFTVHIVAPGITQQQRQAIRVGMSTSVALNLGGPPSIQIPIAAVTLDNGQSVVQLVGKYGKVISAPVVTGQTNQDTVEIKQGLKPGDKIIVTQTSD